MGTMLGKRKRRPAAPRSDSSSGSEIADTQSIFKAHFEASFAPLPRAAPTLDQAVSEDESSNPDDNEDETDWEGISEPENPQPVEVIEHTTPKLPALSKQALKAFMSTKPPTALSPLPNPILDAPPSPTEAAHHLNDLALQRLLSESHLLSTQGSSGTARHRATDLRVQALGAKTSLFARGKMPAGHRRGIEARAGEREEKRRREAREGGVVLEKVGRGKVRGRGRERGIGGPGVGRFTGGTLRLSRRDVIEIEGRRGTGGGGRGKKGARR